MRREWKRRWGLYLQSNFNGENDSKKYIKIKEDLQDKREWGAKGGRPVSDHGKSQSKIKKRSCFIWEGEEGGVEEGGSCATTSR